MCCAVFQCVTTHYKACHIISYKLLALQCVTMRYLPLITARLVPLFNQFGLFPKRPHKLSPLEKNLICVFSPKQANKVRSSHFESVAEPCPERFSDFFVMVMSKEWSKEKRKYPHNFIIEHFKRRYF